MLGQTGEVKAGLAWGSHHFLDPTDPVAIDSTESVARFRAGMDTRPARVFPMRGFSFNLGYDQALPTLGETRHTGSSPSMRMSAFPSCPGSSPGFCSRAARTSRIQRCFCRRVGPGRPVQVSDRFAVPRIPGVGRCRLSELAAGSTRSTAPGPYRLLGTDFYILGNLSAGNCWADLPQVTSLLQLRYGASIGAGRPHQPQLPGRHADLRTSTPSSAAFRGRRIDCHRRGRRIAAVSRAFLPAGAAFSGSAPGRRIRTAASL